MSGRKEYEINFTASFKTALELEFVPNNSGGSK